MTPAKTPPPAPGDILGERYTLKRIEWTSPLGSVWLARDRVLDRAVLVQLLDPSLAADQTTRRAFQKSAARTAQIGAPGLLQVYDIGDQPAFAVLEHASGGRLIDRLSAGPMRTTDAARAALAIARGLESLHERGSWHGALSPSTILFDEEGRAKIFATGMADTARANPNIDVAGEQPVEYRTPEKDPIPADADRYALAALTYQMLTGSPPEPGVSARAKRRSVPVQIDELLKRALSVDPTARPSLDEFEAALAPFARVLPKDVKEPHFAIAEFRWLVPVIVVVVLAVLAITLGVELANNLGNKKSATPKTSATSSANNELTVMSATDFDPLGNHHEHPAQTKFAIDGNPVTKWTTEDYKTADLGGKGGVGLLLDLGSVKSIATVEIQTGIPGWQADIRVSDTQGSQPGDYQTVAADITVATNDGKYTVRPGTRGRYVLLWITRLVLNQSDPTYPYSVEVNEIQPFAA